MKKIKLTVEVECKDTLNEASLVSDLEDSLCCDDVKKSTITYEISGVPCTNEFENPDFEEQ